MPDDRDPPRTDPTPTDVTAVWDRIAPWWSDAVGEGNEFQLQLIMPATDRLLAVRPGEAVLDVACGNGNYARRLGRAGARVVAVDAAAAFVDAARSRTTPADGDVAYRVADATDEAALLSLGAAGAFDAAVCSMALMDLPAIDPLLRALRVLLRPGGRFVFSLPHPCFNSGRVRMTADLVQQDGRAEQSFGVHVADYLTPTRERSLGILNQPEPHWFFHRPLSAVLRACFAAGFVQDGMEEPAFPPGAGGRNPFAWAKRPTIPPALVARVRPAGA